MFQSVESVTEYLRRLDDYCTDHVDETVTIYAPVNHPASNSSKRYLKHDSPTPARSLDGHCFRVVLENSIGNLGADHEEERLFRLGQYTGSLLQPVLNGKMGRYHCLKIY